MSKFIALMKLVALNGKDVSNVIQEYLNPPEGSNVNHIQAKMIGWVQLLHMQTGKILEEFEVLPENEKFQEMVDEAYQYYIIEGNENK